MDKKSLTERDIWMRPILPTVIALCNKLGACLTALTATHRRQLDALLAEALAPVADLKREAAE